MNEYLSLWGMGVGARGPSHQDSAHQLGGISLGTWAYGQSWLQGPQPTVKGSEVGETFPGPVLVS